MSFSAISDPTLTDAAETLQQQLIYNGEVLDIAFESLRTYKEGTQSLAYLDSAVYLAYALLRMLERWEKTNGRDMYVRKKKTKRRKRKGMVPFFVVAYEVQETLIDQRQVLVSKKAAWKRSMGKKPTNQRG
jgi:hypothetical protein